MAELKMMYKGDVFPKKQEQETSDPDEPVWSVPVLIDLDGNKKHLRVGYYNYTAECWELMDCTTSFYPSEIVWCYIDILED